MSGASAGDPVLHRIEAQLSRALDDAGYAGHFEPLRDHRMGYCVGCFECWTQTPGRCRIHDDGWTLGGAVVEADLLVFSGRIRFGGYCSELKKGVDRMLGLVLPFFTVREGQTYHSPRYARYPSLLGVGVQGAADEDEARLFEELVRRNAVNFCAPSWAACVLTADEDASSKLRAELMALSARAVA